MSTTTKAIRLEDLPSPYERRIGHETVYTHWIEQLLDRAGYGHVEPLHAEAWLRVKFPDLDDAPETTFLDELVAAAKLADEHPDGTRALIAYCRLPGRTR